MSSNYHPGCIAGYGSVEDIKALLKHSPYTAHELELELDYERAHKQRVSVQVALLKAIRKLKLAKP